MGIKLKESSYVTKETITRRAEFKDNLWYIYFPSWTWHLSFDFDPKSSHPPTPKTEENWLIGFVQNVLYSYISIEYYGLKPMEISWPKPALDSIASPDYLPFASDPWKQNPNVPLYYRSAARISYGDDKLKLLPDLIKTNGQVISSSGAVNEITLYDQPQINVPQQFNRENLKKVQELTVFKLWVVAQSPRNERFVLANTDPYTLVVVENFNMPVNALDLWLGVDGQVRGKSDNYAVNGSMLKIPKKAPDRKFQPLKLHLGQGSLKPIFDGQTANQRALAWFKQVGLTT